MLCKNLTSLLKIFCRALGFAATRGKLYSRHPDLFKVLKKDINHSLLCSVNEITSAKANTLTPVILT